MNKPAATALLGLCLAGTVLAQTQDQAPPSTPGSASRGAGFASDGGRASAFDMGPLSPSLEEGDDGVWTLREDGGAVVLENGRDPSSVSYHYAGTEPDAEGRREITVDVAVLGSTDGSLAGLLYGFRESPRSYLMFTVGGDRSINLHEMRDGGFEQRTKTGMPELRAERTTLTIRETGDTVSLLVNGIDAGSFGNDLTGGGAVGIVAAGIGAHRFSGFDVRASGAPTEEASTPRRSSGFSEPATSPDASGRAPTATEALEAEDVANAAPPPGDLVEHEVLDRQRGMVSMTVPIPKDWTIDDGTDGVAATGPGGIRVLPQRLVATNYDATDPFVVRTLRQLGQPVVSLVSAERYLTQTIAPQLERRGYTSVDTYPYPVGSDLWRRMVAGTPMAALEYEAVGSDWRLPDGTMANVSVVLAVRRTGAFAQWLVFVDEMQAPAARFEQAKAVLRHSAENTRFNPRWQQAHAAEREESRRRDDAHWAAENARGQAAHRARMSALEATGRSAGQAAKTYGDILDISHEGYLKRGDLVSAGQSRTVDAIAEVDVVSNPGTGERYRVDAGAKHYWINDDGRYLGTDDPLYDPRTDGRVNDERWTQFRIER